MRLTDEEWVLHRLKQFAERGMTLTQLAAEYHDNASLAPARYKQFTEGINDLRRRKLVNVKRGVVSIRDDLRDLINEVERNNEHDLSETSKRSARPGRGHRRKAT